MVLIISPMIGTVIYELINTNENNLGTIKQYDIINECADQYA